MAIYGGTIVECRNKKPYFTSDIQLFDLYEWVSIIYYIVPKDGIVMYYDRYGLSEKEKSFDVGYSDSFEKAVEWINSYGENLKAIQKFHQEFKREHPYTPEKHFVEDSWIISNPIPPHGIYDNYVKIK